MPELPEVEVTRLSLADRIAGARIESVRLGKPLRWPIGIDVKHLTGRVIQRVRRRGKYLIFDLDEGVLLLHLGMSGSLSFAHRQPEAGAHDHFDMVTTKGVLRLNDPRRFGAVVHAMSEDDEPAVKLLGGLGVEPLTDDFTLNAFHAALKRRNTSIKQVLLVGDVVVGVGNIYASEALFMARIRPTLRASKLSKPMAEKLRLAIREVLARAVAKGGSTLRDFSSADGRTGYFQLEAMVYDRAGEPCRVCGTPIKAILQGQRTTYFCPGCQKS